MTDTPTSYSGLAPEAVRAYTNSELDLWRRCRRSWYLTYFRKLEPRSPMPSEARETGTVVHEALAEYYMSNLQTDPVAAAVYHAAKLQDLYPETEEVESRIDQIQDLATKIVEGYLEWAAETGIDQDYEMIGIEEEVQVPISPDDPQSPILLGKIDARFLRHSDGAHIFRDWKVVGNLSDYPKWSHISTQFKHYHLLERLKASTTPLETDPERRFTDGGELVLLRRVKRTARANPPFYARHEVRHNVNELRNYWGQTMRTIRDIQAAERLLSTDPAPDPWIEMYPSPKLACTWDCSFFAACGLADDGSDVEEFLATTTQLTDPLRRYDDFV